MANELKRQLNEIIDGKHIKTVFQPIVSLVTAEIFGYEALSRINCKSAISNTEELFKLADRYERLWDLEQLCRTTALNTVFLREGERFGNKLFLNVNPNILYDENFYKGFTKECLQKYNIKPDTIIFEITERNSVLDMEGFLNIIDHYKYQNYSIAIDDAGSGYSGLNLISLITPHYIKIDINLIKNIHKDKIKYAIVKSLSEFSKITGIFLIAEGVETIEELKILIDLDVQYAQGYFLQRPDEMMLDLNESIKSSIISLNQQKIKARKTLKYYIYEISKENESINCETNLKSVFLKYEYDKLSNGYCIVKDKKPVGIITKNKIVSLFGKKTFKNLFLKSKKIKDFMDSDFLCFDYSTPIKIVIKVAMLREEDKCYDFIVVKKDGEYYGIVTIKDLLENIL